MRRREFIAGLGSAATVAIGGAGAARPLRDHYGTLCTASQLFADS
jgi:hypothetical protein